MGILSPSTFLHTSWVTDFPSTLIASVNEAEQLRKRMKGWPPPNSGVEKYKDGLKGVMAEEIGWVD